MNFEVNKQNGPTLYMIDNDPAHKDATCVGCKFAKIFDSHFVHCNIQDAHGEFRMPPMISNWDNRGRQVLNGTPNQYCPYIHRVKTWKAGKRVPRDFVELIRDMSHERGWEELCPDPMRNYYRKGKWLATANYETRTIRFTRLLPHKTV